MKNSRRYVKKLGKKHVVLGLIMKSILHWRNVILSIEEYSELNSLRAKCAVQFFNYDYELLRAELKKIGITKNIYVLY